MDVSYMEFYKSLCHNLVFFKQLYTYRASINSSISEKLYAYASYKKEVINYMLGTYIVHNQDLL